MPWWGQPSTWLKEENLIETTEADLRAQQEAEDSARAAAEAAERTRAEERRAAEAERRALAQARSDRLSSAERRVRDAMSAAGGAAGGGVAGGGVGDLAMISEGAVHELDEAFAELELVKAQDGGVDVDLLTACAARRADLRAAVDHLARRTATLRRMLEDAVEDAAAWTKADVARLEHAVREYQSQLGKAGLEPATRMGHRSTRTLVDAVERPEKASTLVDAVERRLLQTKLAHMTEEKAHLSEQVSK